jgi:hypothetical protein
VVSREPGLIKIEVDASRGGFFLQLTETDPANYVRNIRVIMPGFEKTYQKDPFHPAFLKRWRGMACLRFMDWMHTNGSKVSTWADRPKPGDQTWSTKGVALEVMIDLANRQKADPWFCMPHLADDEYIRRFAQQVKTELNSGLKVYIEYSNEVWNSQFEQTRYSWKKGPALGLGDPERPWEGGGKYYAQRSVEIFKIWEDVFGETDRLVRVLAWQSGNTWWMENIVCTHNDAYKHADVIAIAPYMGMNVRPGGKDLDAAVVSKWTVDQALDYLEQTSLPKSIRAIQSTKAFADKYDLTLMAYEGGQHMVGVAGGENNKAMEALFKTANRHPRMGKIYRKYFDAWDEAGGDLFCYFSSVGRWGKYGSWGVMEYYDEDGTQAPKYQAVVNWARRCGQKK